jgi:hypothetical protein
MVVRKMAAASALGLSMGLALLGTGVASAHEVGSPVAVATNTNVIKIITANDSFNRRRGFDDCCCFNRFDDCDDFGFFDGFRRFDGFHRFGDFGRFDGF